jgi:hypothetical protein
MAQLQRRTAREYPVRFTPAGLVDALDATNKFPGACITISDLVFDQSNPEIMVSRPGVGTPITSFSGFNTPGVVSVQTTVGDITYGLIATSRNPGNDEPFAYNNATNSFVAVAGVLAANTPTTPSSTGAWTPPTMANVGVFLIVTHPGFAGGATKFGWFDITNPAAPVWTAGDTATNGLPSVPVAVANFSNRAYFACSNSLAYTDLLTLNRAAAAQALTLGDTSAVNALSGLPITTTSSGMTQSLLAFKAFQVWQITGDPVTTNLAQNFISLTIGTNSPRSVWPSPLGVYFSSSSGPWVIDQIGTLRPVVYVPNSFEPDIIAPFQNFSTPSRVAGCYSGAIYRVCGETTIRGTISTNDYWFDEHRRRWTGPHTFSFDCASQYQNYMILCSNANPAKLYKSQVRPDSSSAYNDDGTALSGSLQSSTFPKDGGMTQKQMVEATQELSSSTVQNTYTIQAYDDQQNTLDNVQIAVAPSGKVWGSNVWGDGSTWKAAINRPRVYNVPWTQPIVFQKLSLAVSAVSNSALAIGTFFALYRDTGMTNVPNP